MMLVLIIALFLLSLALLIGGAMQDELLPAILGVVGIVLGSVLCIGFFVVQPNTAAVLIFFGKYVGSVKENGFWWVNPFTMRRKISLRMRNLNGDRL
jgi:regulator of protease activity HflC (stomatin/prohibitin superfamily)